MGGRGGEGRGGEEGSVPPLAWQCFLQVLEEEDLAGNAARMGVILQQELSSLDPQIVTNMRGVGLFWAIVIKSTAGRLA